MNTTTSQSPSLDDPAQFAQELSALLAGVGEDPRLTSPAPAQYTEYRAALAALRERHPEEAAFDAPTRTLDEAAHAWSGESYAAGVAFGAAAESVRRTMVDPQAATRRVHDATEE